MTQAQTSQFCPNGHAVPNTRGRFCIECGVALVLQTPTPPVAPTPPTPVAPIVSAPVPVPIQIPTCPTCGGQGKNLPQNIFVCPKCAWLRPLVPNYHLDCSAFQWSQDGTAMATLRSIGPLNMSARYISDRIGRSWIEATFNAVKLGPNQLPHIYDQTVMAARILGMTFMPDVYISGERMWDAMTFGSDTSAFIVIGTALINNFRDKDLLFVLAREIGHCRAGHALWKTVLRFLVGEMGPRKGLSGGVLAMFSPSHLIGGALEMPLMAWARQAEITADRAGLLAVGDESIARRVLLSWSLRSSALYKQINAAAWMEQEKDGDSDLSKLSEIATSATPYISRRLKLVSTYAKSPEFPEYRKIIEPLLPAAYWQIPNAAPPPAPTTPALPPAAPQPFVRLACPSCKTPMRIPADLLAGKSTFSARCPNTQCAKVLKLRQQPKSLPASTTN